MTTRRAWVGDEVLLRRLRVEALMLAPEPFGSTFDRELARTTEGLTVNARTELSIVIVWTREKPVGASARNGRSSLGYSGTMRKYVNLRGGDHFDNLGLYEPIRRRCKYIIVCDEDEQFCEGRERLERDEHDALDQTLTDDRAAARAQRETDRRFLNRRLSGREYQ